MAEPIPCASFPNFSGTGLEDSYVLEIRATPGRLNITTWTGRGSIRPAVDASGEQDWGGIDALRQLGAVYQLEGDWGTIEVVSQEPIVRIIDS